MKPKFYHCTNKQAAPGKDFMLFAGEPAFFCEVIESDNLPEALETEAAYQARAEAANMPAIGSRTFHKGKYYSLLAIAVFEPVQNADHIARVARKMADWYLYNILMKGENNENKT